MPKDKIPRRFYVTTRDGRRALKFPEDEIRRCHQCGTHFRAERDDQEHCSPDCERMEESYLAAE